MAKMAILAQKGQKRAFWPKNPKNGVLGLFSAPGGLPGQPRRGCFYTNPRGVPGRASRGPGRALERPPGPVPGTWYPGPRYGAPGSPGTRPRGLLLHQPLAAGPCGPSGTPGVGNPRPRPGRPETPLFPQKWGKSRKTPKMGVSRADPLRTPKKGVQGPAARGSQRRPGAGPGRRVPSTVKRF